MPMMTERNESDVSIKELCQALGDTKGGRVHSVDEFRPAYLNKVE